MRSLGVSVSDLEPGAADCTRVWVWHTRTERAAPPRLEHIMDKFQGTNIRQLYTNLNAKWRKGCASLLNLRYSSPSDSTFTLDAFWGFKVDISGEKCIHYSYNSKTCFYLYLHNSIDNLYLKLNYTLSKFWVSDKKNCTKVFMLKMWSHIHMKMIFNDFEIICWEILELFTDKVH